MNGATHTGEQFLHKITAIIEANLQNEQFGVTVLSQQMNMSRSHIYRQLKQLTQLSISQFIRKVRLEKAMELLSENNASASEIAYKVGFGSPAYFNYCFHEHFGFTPGDLKKRALNTNDTNTDTNYRNHDLNSEWELPSGAVPAKRINKKTKAMYYSIAVLFALSLLFTVYNIVINTPQMQKKLADTKKSIVVLPFKNTSEDPEYKYFTDGITEDILNNLCHFNALRVVSRKSAEQFSESELPVKEIARKLNVDFVLDGSVSRHEDKTRISVKLIDAVNDNNIWSANFDRELTDIFNIQDEIAIKVAHNLNTVLSEDEIRKIEKTTTLIPEAYDYYLRARFLLHQANSVQRADFERDGVLNCIQYYEKAIAADSTFADAYAGLSNAWFNLSAWGFLPPREGFPKAKTYSSKAIEIDPDCGEAHAVLGAHFIWGGKRNIAEGSKELKKAVELNPNFATAHQWYAQCLMITGPIEEARLHVNRALELEPYFWVVQTLSAWIYYFEKEYDLSLKNCRIAQDMNPDFTDIKWLLVLNYYKLGEGEKMVQELQSIIKKYTPDEKYLDEVQVAFSKKGINGIFSWLIEVNTRKPIPVEGMDGHPFYCAWWNAILGNKDDAVYWLDRTLEHPRPLGQYSNLITTNPDFDLLRNDPRFLQIVDKAGLKPALKHLAKK